ncbi:MAG: hypothetical protein R3E01_35275 [Pirellulaceae bacterium]
MIHPSMGFMVILVMSSTAHSAFVLDDFDDSQEALCGRVSCSVPSTELTLKAQGVSRYFEVNSTRYDTVRIDANISSPSTLTLEAANPIPNTAGYHLYVDYNILDPERPLDITEGGLNNAAFVEFESIDGLQPPLFLRMYVRDDALRSPPAAVFVNLPQQSGPFTVVLPFNAIVTPDPSVPTVDLTRLKNINFLILLNDPVQGEIWKGEIAQIRFGSTVPEPGFSLLWLLVTLLVAYRR